MNKTLMAAGLAVILGACSSSKKSDVAEGATPNPFFAEYTTPFGVPPFDHTPSSRPEIPTPRRPPQAGLERVFS